MVSLEVVKEEVAQLWLVVVSECPGEGEEGGRRGGERETPEGGRGIGYSLHVHSELRSK